MGHGQVVFFCACVTCAHLALMHLVSSFIPRCLVSEVQAVSVKVHADTGKVQTACKCVNSCCSALQRASAAPNGHSWAIQALDSGLVPAILKSAPRIDQLKNMMPFGAQPFSPPTFTNILSTKQLSTPQREH